MTETTVMYHVEQELASGVWVRLGEYHASLFEAFTDLQKVSRENPSQSFTLVEQTTTKRVLT